MRVSSARRRWLVAIAVLVVGCGSPGASRPAATSAPATAAPPAATSPSVPASIAPSAATPAITGLTGHVVFARAGGEFGDETTFAMNIDGSDLHQIGELGKSGFPFPSWDGKRISVGTELGNQLGSLLFDVSGENRYVVPQTKGLMFGSAPITPDGKFLVAETFTSPAFAFEGTNVINIATGKMRKLIGSDKHFISGDVSPDGKQVLLFLNDPDVDPPEPGALWVIGLDGTGLRQLTPDATYVECCMNYRWSPDGKTVLFATSGGKLLTIGADGSNLTELFYQAGKWAITPTYSPDGSMIMFALDPDENPFAHPVNALYVIRADGSDLTLVFDTDYFKREPAWLP